MKTYAARIADNVVEEIIVGDFVWANENLEGEWVDCTDNGELIAGVGYTYDADTNDFVAPPAPVVPE
jgi:hypothetical protein